jgi:hypothetical protein
MVYNIVDVLLQVLIQEGGGVKFPWFFDFGGRLYTLYHDLRGEKV